MPTDSGVFRSQFCGRESLTQSLSWAAWHSKRQRHTASHSARIPPERHAPASARAANDREPRSPLRAYWSVYELAHRAPSSHSPRRTDEIGSAPGRRPGRAAGREALERNAPNLLAHYPYLWEPTVVRQVIETAWTSVSQGGHSSRYWCQQDSVFARRNNRGGNV